VFEDALMESGGKIGTHRGSLSGVAAICNCSIVCLLVVWPLLDPASLPKRTLSVLLAAPAPPPQPLAHMPRTMNVAPRVATFASPFTVPRLTPDHIPTADHEPPPAVGTGIAPFAREGGDSLAGLPDSIGTVAPPQVHIERTKRLAISSGVMEGQKLSGADPRYPAIAIAARVQGIVVLAATISRTGTIENLRVVAGPPMLAPAAEEAVRTWRYRPYSLNGEPVEVETTVRVVFHLGG
jgi:periplasmic protein TonB